MDNQISEKQFMGIGIGASTIKIVVLSGDGKPVDVVLRDHRGSPREHLIEALQAFDPTKIAGIVVTGHDAANQMTVPTVFEAETVEYAVRMLGMKANSVASMGGESFVVYPLDDDGYILDYVSGNKCAAGTVEFFKQQLMRMNLTVKEACETARQGKVVPLAKRCSVHCKSDCTHALNKKSCSVDDIVLTLCHNMAEKVAALLRSAKTDNGKIAVIGGASQNDIIVQYLKEHLSNCEIVVPEEGPYFEAMGAAGLAMTKPVTLTSWDDIFKPHTFSFSSLPPLGEFEEQVNDIQLFIEIVK